MNDDSSTPAADHDTRTGTAPRGAGNRRAHWGLKVSIVLVMVLVIAGVGLTGVALGHFGSRSEATITVTGSGTVHGTPDTMDFQIGVQTVAKSATSALAENNARVGSLESSLLAHGVTRNDLQTSGLNIYENTNSSGQMTGFTVVDTLSVTMHHLGKAGAAIDAAAQATGNGIQLYGVSFSISNESNLLASARARAMHNARTVASQVASGGGANLGSIIRITDQENSNPPNIYYPSASLGDKASGVPIQAGSQTVNVTVTVVYALKR